MFVVIIKKRAQKQLRKISRTDHQKIIRALRDLEVNPYTGKKLEGEQLGRWSVRVWPYRIIYSIKNSILTVEVLAIGHRKDVYKFV